MRTISWTQSLDSPPVWSVRVAGFRAKWCFATSLAGLFSSEATGTVPVRKETDHIMAGKSCHNRDEAIIEAVSRGECQMATARLAGCSVTTVRRRLEDPDFRGRIERSRAEVLDAAAGQFGATVGQAVSTLKVLMTETMPPAVRLGAARAVCDFALRVRESISWERRLADLESRLAQSESQRREAETWG